jgi:hypothetical protein
MCNIQSVMYLGFCEGSDGGYRPNGCCRIKDLKIGVVGLPVMD